MRFRLVLKLSTLDDLERLIRTLLQKRCVFCWSPLQNFYAPIVSGQKYRPITPVSRNIRCMRIFTLVPLAVGLSTTVFFGDLGIATSSETLEIRPSLLYGDMLKLSACDWLQSEWPRMTLSGYFMSSSVSVPAVLNSHKSTVKDNGVKTDNNRPILSAAKT